MTASKEMNADDKAFYHELVHASSLVVVIRSAIRIEGEITELLRSRVLDASAFEKIDLTYFQRIQLAVAFGLQPRLLKPLKTLGEIRNKFAHNVRPEIGKSDADNFYDAFDPIDKQIIQNSYAAIRKENIKKLRRPKKIQDLSSLDRFALYATTLRSAVIAARQSGDATALRR